MSEVTKEDFNEFKKDIKDNISDLYEKHNESNKVMSSMAVNVAEIATTLKTMPKPPKQPCEWHNQLRAEHDRHIDKHEAVEKEQQHETKENINLWKKPVIATIVKAIEILLTGGIIYFFVK